VTPLDVDVEVARPTGEMTPRFRRWLATLVGIAALSAAFLSWVETDSGRKEEQAFVDASRSAIEAFVTLGASASRSNFQLDALRRAAKLGIEASARGIHAPEADFWNTYALSRAQNAASDRLLERVQAMSDLPRRHPRVDQAMIDALQATNPLAAQPIVDEANAAVDRTGTYGTRQERAMFALGLVAIGASLLGLAGLMGATRGGRISLVTATGALTFALAWGLSGFVI
jgi:hypothetical protein